MARSEKAYLAFKRRMQTTGDLTSNYPRLIDAFKMAGFQCPSWWLDYYEGGDSMLTGPVERDGYYDYFLKSPPESEDYWFRWLYYGDIPRFHAIYEAFSKMMDRVKAKSDLERHKPKEGHKSRRPARVGYLYVLKSGDRYKIGRTRNIIQRMKDHVTSSPHEVELLFYFKVADDSSIEQELHQGFGPKRCKGEWFELEEIELQAIREYLRQREVA